MKATPRVIGSAETGKAVVALHRSVRLTAEALGNRVLLTTLSAELARGLAEKIDRLTRGRPDLAGRITVSTLGEVARSVAAERLGQVALASEAEIDTLLAETAGRPRAARSTSASWPRNGG